MKFKKLENLIQKKRLVSTIGCVMRFHPCLKKIKHLISEGEIGKILYVRMENGSYMPDWHRKENYRKSYDFQKIVVFIKYDENLDIWVFGGAEFNYGVYFALSILIYSILIAIKKGSYKTHISSLISIGFIIFLVSSVYTLPYFISVIEHGSDNYHWIFTYLVNFDFHLVTFGLGFMGLTFILGILGIFILPKSNFKLILIITLGVLFIGRFHVYLTKDNPPWYLSPFL